MPFVIYDPGTKSYRHRRGYEKWDEDINSAGIFETAENAGAKIKSNQLSWRQYVEDWAGHENLPIALVKLTTWTRAVVKEIRFALL